MKGREFLDWFLEETNCDAISKIDVPEEPIQTEEWWWDNVGSLPPSPIPAGEYLMAIPDSYNQSVENLCSHFTADVEIESGDGYIYLFKLED